MSDERTALIVGTSKGPADAWLERAAEIDAIARGATMGIEPMTPFGLHTLATDLARDIDHRGPRLTLSAACASGLVAVARALLMLRTRAVDRAIVVASESSMHPLWHGTFRRLGVLAKPGQPCRPLDEHRDGFVVSEAAAAIVIERRPATAGEIVVDAAEVAADATHLTGMDASGRTLANLVGRLGEATPIDLVHAHATATANDTVELTAIRDGLRRQRPTLYSHKGSLGHTLGASGLISVVLTTRMHRSAIVPAMVTTTTPIGSRATSPTTIQTSLSLAAGFGGTLAGIRLRTA